MLLGYCRVSTAEQAANNRTSMKEQERIVTGFGMMRGIATYDTAFFKDPGVSGATPVDQRPSGAEMLKMARSGDIICASKLDRMFRDSLDALQVSKKLKKEGVELVLLDMGDQPVTSDGMAKCFFTMAAAFATLERERIAERMMDGRRAKAERGGHIGGPPPYGFQKVGTGRDAMLEPDLEEQDIMRQVLRMSGYKSPSRICRTLQLRGIRPRMGARWQSIQIIRIRAHAKDLWPDLAPHRFKSDAALLRPVPKELTVSPDGAHVTAWM